MKVADFNKLINAALKRAAKTRSWSSSGFVAFRREGPLFFYLAVLPSGKGRLGLTYVIRYKLIAMEDLFWKIVGMPANSDAPLSVRAKGAFAFVGIEIGRHDRPECPWTPELIEDEMRSLLACAVDRAEAVSARVHTFDDNMAYFDEQLSSQPNVPQVLARSSPEQVLTHLLKGEIAEAAAIVEERIHVRKSAGGIRIGGHSFYEYAKWYIESLA